MNDLRPSHLAAPSVSKRSNDVLSLLQSKFPGYHPIVAMAEMAHRADVDPAIEFQCHKELAKYVAPTLKSTEVHTTSDDLPTVKVVMFDQAKLDAEDAEIVNWVI